MFHRTKIAIFCDGDFWHGRNWRRLKIQLAGRHNAPYWISKIEANRKRDRIVNGRLKRAGWAVFRLWETNILRDPAKAARTVIAFIMAMQEKSAQMPTGHSKRC